jgi:ATP-dependent Clp protease ATP-binding subunit ClpC
LRRTVDAAEAQCRALRHGYLGTEHLLLGLLACEDTSAAHRVVAAGGSLEDVRSLVVRIVGLGKAGSEVRSLPYTLNAFAVCGRVAGEAERFGPAAIGTEHVLRAVLRRRSIAFHVLADLGVDPEALAKRVPRLRRGA